MMTWRNDDDGPRRRPSCTPSSRHTPTGETCVCILNSFPIVKKEKQSKSDRVWRREREAEL
jgi:hypothetical protein